MLEFRNFIERTEGHGKTFALSEAGGIILDSSMPIWKKAQKFLGEEDSKAILRISSKLQDLEKAAHICYGCIEKIECFCTFCGIILIAMGLMATPFCTEVRSMFLFFDIVLTLERVRSV